MKFWKVTGLRWKQNGLCLLLISISGFINSQDIWTTNNGILLLTGVLSDSPFVASSDKAIVLLDYENAEFSIRVDKSTITTDIDSIDARLNLYVGDYLQYQGELGIDFVKTQKHQRQDFEVKGYLNCGPHNELIIGRGKIEHIFAGIYSCTLNMSFHVNLDDLDLNINLPGLENEVHVEIIQTILTPTQK